MRLLTYRELKELKGIPHHRVHIDRLVKEGRFPKPVRLTPARLAFVESEVDAWLDGRIAERDAEAA